MADDQSEADYFYGGTRMVETHLDDSEILRIIKELAIYESALKNRLINIALRKMETTDYQQRVPPNFLESHVGGARCVIRPKGEEIYRILQDPAHSKFQETLLSIFEQIGGYLNREQGRVKLTPDYGRFAGLADLLAQFTPHVLGIRCEDGGCGGKSSYAATGIIAALEALDIAQYKDGPITLIGSAGALGSDVLTYFLQENFNNVAVCDLAYDANHQKAPPDAHLLMLSQYRKFTDACLQRGEIIVATTVGQELENSNWRIMPQGTIIFLAHNLAIPQGDIGVGLMRNIANQGVLAIPGQVLTLGGALTSRLEWFWRQAMPGYAFDKPLAHSLVRHVVQFLIKEVQETSRETRLSPYEAMLLYAQMI